MSDLSSTPSIDSAEPAVDTWRADLFLLHAPSVYDFRDRDDVLFAYLSDSDSVNVTSIYEMYPLGLFSIQAQLRAHGMAAEIVNLASLMLMYPKLDVEKLLGKFSAPVFGFDLHWMPHCHGSIELAKRLKIIHPDSLIIFGGISATYYAEQLIQYPAVDIVVRGYDTLEPVTRLLQTVKSGERNFKDIPNLVYKKSLAVVRNDFSHKPMKNYNDRTTDWSFFREATSDVRTTRQIMTLPNTGCAYDCNWCGGSRFAYKNIMGVNKTLIYKDNSRVVDELRTLSGVGRTTSIYALQCYSESKTRMFEYLDAVKEVGIKSVFFEQFYLTDQATLNKMGESTQAHIMLSPESSDPAISKMAGRGTYTMAEMEEWIPRALDAGVASVMVWFFIGMRQQTAQSVLNDVSYSASLMKKFGKRVVPLMCPMVPFLDPGSRFFEEPEEHGYRIFHRTLEEHRQAMVEPIWHRRLNYETEWLSRRGIQDISYQAIAQLVRHKGELGILPSSFCNTVLTRIDETVELLAQMERAFELDGTLPNSLRKVIVAYNGQILSYSSDQIVPIARPFGGRWFDDFATPRSLVQSCLRA
jgi:clorobiocin biosynthesis protein CloN6